MLCAGGELATMIERDGVSGVTSYPRIFEKATNGSDDYDAHIEYLIEQQSERACKEIFFGSST